MHSRSSWPIPRERLAFHGRAGPVLPGNDIGINITVTLLTRHKYHCAAVKNPLTSRVDNRSSLTLRPGFRVGGPWCQLLQVRCAVDTERGRGRGGDRVLEGLVEPAGDAAYQVVVGGGL